MKHNISDTAKPLWVESGHPQFPTLICTDEHGFVDPHVVEHTLFEIDMDTGDLPPPIVENRAATRAKEGHWSVTLPRIDRVYALRWEIQPRLGEPVFDLIVPTGKYTGKQT